MKRESLETISNYFKIGNQVIFTNHFYDQMKGRKFSIGQVYGLLKSDSLNLIQIHPPGTYKYNNKKLNKDFVYVLSAIVEQTKAHLVLCKKGNNFIGVSIYYPSHNVFTSEDILKKRV